jgi:hypothetical protein
MRSWDMRMVCFMKKSPFLFSLSYSFIHGASRQKRETEASAGVKKAFFSLE